MRLGASREGGAAEHARVRDELAEHGVDLGVERREVQHAADAAAAGEIRVPADRTAAAAHEAAHQRPTVGLDEPEEVVELRLVVVDPDAALLVQGRHVLRDRGGGRVLAGDVRRRLGERTAE